jgi:hypothetical protein
MPKKTRSPIRFTAGDYYRPQSAQDALYYYGEAQRNAWVRVLQAIEKLAPQIVKSLARDVFPIYQRAAQRVTGYFLTDWRALETLSQQPNAPQSSTRSGKP